MLFHVEVRDGSKSKIEQYPFVLLVQDNWDDYFYKTTFYVTLHLSSEEKIDLGNVKILKKDQRSGYTEMPKKPFTELNGDYCSLGANLDYYESLFKHGPKIYIPYLKGIRDVTYDDEIKATFEDMEGYRVSLLRFSGAERTIADARKLFKRTSTTNRRRNPGFKVKFKTSVSSNSDPFTLELDFRRQQALPNRTNVLLLRWLKSRIMLRRRP